MRRPSLIVRARINQYTARPFMLNSVPKSGTHLLMKVMTLVGCRKVFHLDGNRIAGWPRPQTGDDAVRVSLAPDAVVTREAMAAKLAEVGRGRYLSAHIPFSAEMASVLRERGMPTFLVLRDPRDVVVSHAKYVSTQPDHNLFAYYSGLDLHEQIMTSIRGLPPETGLFLESIGDLLRAFMPWISQPGNETVYFESLVGPQGGGSYDEQISTLSRVTAHVGLHCSDRDIEDIAARLFGGTATFRGGQIGSWRDALSPDHKEAFKGIAGELLIELGYERDLNW